MKPRIDYSKPVQQRSGYPARLLCTDAKGEFPVVALLSSCGRGGDDYAVHFTADGYCYNDGERSERDLVNVPPAPRNVRLWVYIDRYGNLSTMYNPPTNYTELLACKEFNLTITEGEGLGNERVCNEQST